MIDYRVQIKDSDYADPYEHDNSQLGSDMSDKEYEARLEYKKYLNTRGTKPISKMLSFEDFRKRRKP